MDIELFKMASHAEGIHGMLCETADALLFLFEILEREGTTPPGGDPRITGAAFIARMPHIRSLANVIWRDMDHSLESLDILGDTLYEMNTRYGDQGKEVAGSKGTGGGEKT
jgi:hypothetical protein